MCRFFLVTASLFLLSFSSFAQQSRFVGEAGIDVGDCADPENPCATIGFAIDQSESGDIIDIAAGIYTENIMIDKDLTVQGAGRDETILQAHAQPGQASGRAVTIEGVGLDVEITGMAIRHGVAAGSPSEAKGGGVFISESTLALANITFEENVAMFGGGVYNESGLLVLNDVIFSGNVADSLGGGMFNNESSPTLTDVAFFDNMVTGSCGFPICGGGGMYNDNSSPSLTAVEFATNEAGSFGGGMFNESSSPVLTTVTFSENAAGVGGGMHNEAGSAPILTNVVFLENTASLGAGMANNLSAPDLTGVVFRGNVAGSEAFVTLGGGMSNNVSSPVLTDVLFEENSAGFAGGGMSSNSSDVVLANVTFRGNVAGGGMFNSGGESILVNVLFHENSAEDWGGGLVNNNSSSTVTNATFSGNTATFGGAIVNWFPSSSPVFTNTILWGNEAVGLGSEVFNVQDASITLRYSLYDDGPGAIVEGGGFEAENSLTVDPFFVDAENGNFRLMETSPAIGAGNPNTDFALFPVNDDGEPIDLDGNPRVFGETIDIGAFEHQGTVDEETSPEALAEILSAPSPNPVQGSASFALRVAEAQEVVIEVFDALGRHVKTLYDGALPAGTSEILTLDASVLPAGVYMIRATGEDFSKTRQVTIAR